MVSAVASQRDGSRSVLCMRGLSERITQVQKRNESINQVENVALSLKRCVFLVLQTRRHFRGPIQKASLAKLIFFFVISGKRRHFGLRKQVKPNSESGTGV